jgi:predicted GIY-YIG superfamily endonuclease
MFYTYILQLSDKTFYHGSSTNLKQRLLDHQRGNVPSTKNFRPVKLIFYAAFITKEKALGFEQYLKTGSGYSFRNKHFI